jgi:hypothetical protein
MANRKRDSEGKFASKGVTGPLRDNPWTSAAIAAGAAGIGAFLWSKRNQIGEAVDSGMDRLSEFKAERMGGGDDRTQEEISEEALTLKETGAKSKPQTSNQEAKAGAKAFS